MGDTLEGEEYYEPEDMWDGIIGQVNGGSEIRDVMRDFTSAEDLEGLTRLNQHQINLFAVMRSMADSYPGMGLEKFPQWFMKLQLSLDGKSRAEIVDIMRGRLPLQTQEEKEAAEAGKY